MVGGGLFDDEDGPWRRIRLDEEDGGDSGSSKGCGMWFKMGVIGGWLVLVLLDGGLR